MEKIREKGYYWVRVENGVWEIAHFDTYDNAWTLMGISPLEFRKEYPKDDYFEEINENIIERK